MKLDNFLFKISITIVFILAIFIFLFSLNTFFVLISPARVIGVFPSNESKNIELDSPLVIEFNKPVRRKELQPSILPEVHGEWKFQEPFFKNHFFRDLVFTPAIDFEPETQYQVRIENIKGFGLNEKTSFSFTFITQPSLKTNSKPSPEENQESEREELKPEVTMLKIPLDWQDYPLSCEAASLKMALKGKGITVSENEIMGEIGYDLTPRQENIWGDPYQSYVGDINGKMCRNGYGVYWQPVASAAQNYLSAEFFSNWGIENLTTEIQLGNSIIVWGTLIVETPTDCSWHTPEGKYIKAFKETHVRLAIGFIGNQKNPSMIILNDPLAGRVYWPTAYFLKNWGTFDYSGVVIR